MIGTSTPRQSRKRQSAVAAAEEIQKLVAVLQRQFALRPDSLPRPDDAAARALGYQLGQALVTFLTVCLDETFLQSVRETLILEGLFCRQASSDNRNSGPLHPSVAAALFQHMQRAYQEDDQDLLDLHWLTGWIVRLEEVATAASPPSANRQVVLPVQSTLQHALHTYRHTLLAHHEVSATQFLQLYQSLQQPSTRLRLIYMALPVSQRPSYDILASLWAIAATENSSDATAGRAILQQTSEALRSWLARDDISAKMAILNGFTDALEWSMYLSPAVLSGDVTLWWSWWKELRQLGLDAWGSYVDEAQRTDFLTWWRRLWNASLPLLMATTMGDTVLEETFDGYHGPSLPDATHATLAQQPLQMNPLSALSWASWLLTSHDDKQMPYEYWYEATKGSTSHTVQALRRFVTLCLASNAHWRVSLAGLQEWETPKGASRFYLLSPLLTVSLKEAEKLWEDLLAHCDFSKTKYSRTQQSTALLCGMLLLQSNLSDGVHYLKHLIRTYPHLSITLMPVIVSLLNLTAAHGDGRQVLHILEFGCQVLVLDPHAATEFWNILLRLLQPEESETDLRATILRYFPTLCQSNRRLYRRVIETLGSAVGDPSVDIRLAAAATVAEMCKKDLIRDVSDVIGWVQGWLSIPEPLKALEKLIVRHALDSLHYLVEAEELDFDVVVKVLNKRLCPITDIERIRNLHPVVQESFVRLLGDGESSSDDSEVEETAQERGTPVVSPQVQRAVQTLMELGVIMVESLAANSSNASPSSSKSLQYRIACAVIASLNNYSDLALGLDQQEFREAVLDDQASPDSAALLCHQKLKEIVVAFAENLPVLTIDDCGDQDMLVKLSQRLIKFEEDSLGVNLWQKSGRQTTRSNAAPTKTLQSVLPTVSAVGLLASQHLSMASTIAGLFCVEEPNLRALRDLVDATLELDNPLFYVLFLQGHLSLAPGLISANSHEVNKILDEVGSWEEDLANVDQMYLSLSALSMFAPPKLRATDNSENTVLEDIAGKVIHAFRDFRFENSNLGRISLGLVGASSLRLGNLTIANEVVDTLTDSVRGYGGEASFGALYGLSLVAQMLPLYQQNSSDSEIIARQTYYRIVGILLDELLQCYESEENAVTSLLACIKSGTIHDDILSSLKLVPAESILLDVTQAETAKYLSICCAVALPTLGRLNTGMLSAVVQLFELLEWGGGKGFVMPPMLRACQTTGTLNLHEIRIRYDSYSKILEKRIEAEDSSVADLLVAVSGASSESISHILRRRVIEGTFLDADASSNVLLATLMKCIGIPCFGSAPFMQPLFVNPGVSKLDIHDVAEILEESVDRKNSDGSAKKEMGLVALAVMASSSRARPNSVDNAIPAAFVTQAAQFSEYSIKSTDFAKLPSPLERTALSGFLNILERIVVVQSSTSH